MKYKQMESNTIYAYEIKMRKRKKYPYFIYNNP